VVFAVSARGALVLSLLVSLLLLVATSTSVQGEAASSVYYLLVYNPVENTGILVINATISLPNCGYVAIPVRVLNEESAFTFLNYTVSGGLLVAGVDYNETAGYVTVFACNSGEISLVFTASNVFTELGLGAYASSVDTTPLRALGASSTVELRITGSYDVDIASAGVTHTVSRTADTTTIVISGHGRAYLTLTSSIEVVETPTPTPTPTKPPEWYERPEVIIGVVVAVVAVVAAVALLARKK
jgi:hypothetical protein